MKHSTASNYVCFSSDFSPLALSFRFEFFIPLSVLFNYWFFMVWFLRFDFLLSFCVLVSSVLSAPCRILWIINMFKKLATWNLESISFVIVFVFLPRDIVLKPHKIGDYDIVGIKFQACRKFQHRLAPFAKANSFLTRGILCRWRHALEEYFLNLYA